MPAYFKIPVFLLALLYGNSLKAQGYYLFIGSYNWNKNKPGIYVYQMDSLTGKLTEKCGINNILNPSYLTLSSDGRYLYSVSGSRVKGDGGVCSFSFDSLSGKLSLINEQSCHGENPVYIAADKSDKWLVNANYASGSVSVFPVKKGTIGACVQNIAFTGHGINAERQEKSHIHATVFSPKQDYLLLPDLGADKIRSLEFHPNQEKPLDSATETFAVSVPGSGPRHLAFHPNGRFCYCIEELSGTISAYMYEKGKLTPMQHLTNHLWRVKSDYSSADIHLSPDGLFLYASNRGNENNIAIYSVNPLTGLLKPLGFQSVKGDHPRNFVIDPSGKFLIVANQISGNVVVFRRNMITGLLTSTKVNIKVPGASCLQIKKYQ